MTRGYTLECDDAVHAAAGGDYDFWTGQLLDDERKVKPTVLVIDVTSELGDAQEEHVRVRMLAAYNYGSGGTATTARPLDPNDAAPGSTVWECANATTTSLGSGRNVMSDGFNVRLGYRRLLPEHLYAQSLHDSLHIRQMGGLTDDIAWSSTLSFIEMPF